MSSFFVFLRISSTNEVTCFDFAYTPHFFQEAPSFDLQHVFRLKPFISKYLSRCFSCTIEKNIQNQLLGISEALGGEGTQQVKYEAGDNTGTSIPLSLSLLLSAYHWF